ncbi:hypothetical protein COB55_03440 [Candidatus Wolfebacteria bacterium]|nr:MAG: hypothetical protein COB55_03440 [Candidatus Wolfebacteria bacterium]
MLRDRLREQLRLHEDFGEHGHHVPMQNRQKTDTFTQDFINDHGSKQYKEVIEKVKRYTGQHDVDPRQLMGHMMQSLNRIEDLEQDHHEELEKLAVRMVMWDFDIPKNTIDFDVKITRNVDVGRSVTQVDKGEVTPEIISKFSSEESMDSRVKKRRQINAMIQGMSSKGHYMFHLADKELNNISPELVNLYGSVASIGDFGYWTVPDEMSKQFSQMPGAEEAKGGEVRVSLGGERPKIIARGKNFSILVHEVIKGVMELISLHGLPSDREKRQEVMKQADYFGAEAQDLRYGPKLWEKFINSIDDEDLYLKSHIYERVVKLPHREFNSLMQEVIKGSDRAKQLIKSIANEIKEDLR